MSEPREMRVVERRAARRIARRRKPPPQGYRPPPPAAQMRARLRGRHLLVVASFLLLFVLPAGLVNWYLQARAADQFVSRAALTVTSDDFLASAGMIDDLLSPVKAEASDTDILFAYILSQEMVARVDARLGLRDLYRRQAGADPLLALGEDASLEDLAGYWRWMVDVAYEARQGIVNLRVRAFAPEDAQAINRAIIEESRRLVNALTETARRDAVRFAEQDLAEARVRLEELWAGLRAFRNENRVVLPSAEAAGRFAILGSLQDMMADTLVERASLIETTRQGDPRLAQLDRRVAAISAQIAAERARLGSETAGPEARPISEVLGIYEAMLVDIEFAQGAYLMALAQLDGARTEARRLSRYLSVHVSPTLPQSSEYPQRVIVGTLVTGLLLTGWLIVVFVGYNLRDSR
jgi:capsular polysaccharide transport system permease protein